MDALELYMLPAGNGDCFWLEYGDVTCRKRILIDCGTEASWPALLKRIKAIPTSRPRIDLLVITHIDDDHIGGALPLLYWREGLELDIGEIWFNDADKIAPTVLGTSEGIVLSQMLSREADLRSRWNSSVPAGGAVRTPDSGTAETWPSYRFGDLTLTVLSPTDRHLRRLKKKWDDAVCELNEKKAADPGYKTNPEKWLGGAANTADKPRHGKPDRSINNGSSIAFLATYKETSILFGADAFASTLLNSLRQLPVVPSISCFKLSHHGSTANITPALLAAINTRHYLISTDGTGHGHPHVETLELLTKGDTPKTLHFNYPIDHVCKWLASHPSGAGRRYEAVFVDSSQYLVRF